MITAHLTIQARITPITARSWEAAKIQSTWRTSWDLLSRPPNQASTATTASTMTVHFVTSCRKRTSSDSSAAIHNAARIRRRSSQRPARLDPCSIACGESLSNLRSTVPRWWCQPRARAPSQPLLREVRLRLVMEQPVDGRACAADVGAERTEPFELGRERRLGEIVRRQSGEVARAAKTRQRVAETRAPLLPPGRAVAIVERAIHRCG